MKSIGSPYVDNGKQRAFLRKLFARKARELLSLSRNQLIILTKLVIGHWIKRSSI
jgi:hypothetical protein